MLVTKKKIIEDYKKKFLQLHGKELESGNKIQQYEALGELVRNYLTEDWINTNRKYSKLENKQVHYLSMEFLLGRLLGNSLLNLGIRDTCEKALKELDIDLFELENIEQDQGLGNGGLGRLAACFLDSMASTDIAGHGCGIRYKYGFFEQKLVDGKQVEVADTWLKSRNVWEIKKEDKSEIVKFYGRIEIENSGDKIKFIHKDYESVVAVPYDTPIVGYENNLVNTLRLWGAEPCCKEFDFSAFNNGEIMRSQEYKTSVESITLILYPEDSFYEGKLLRLKQEYFLVSAGVQSIFNEYKNSGGDILSFSTNIAIHINDTHPTLAIPELMRILMDEEGLGWDEAWEITKNTVSYTNHTILAEALEKWPIDMLRTLLPRIYMIIEEINERHCKNLWAKYPGEWTRISRLSIIGDGYIRMASLAIVGSHSINGVAKLHTEILKNQEMSEFYALYPDKFNNKTNGITHRRWLIGCNPLLTELLKSTIGDGFIKNPLELRRFEKHLKNKKVIEALSSIKKENKKRLAKEIFNTTGIVVNTDSIFDVHVKRIHSYKRQTLNCLRIMDLYNKILENPKLDIVPRTFIFAGKSAPGYYLAKNTIELISSIAEKINNDKVVAGKIKIVMLDNYKVSLAEKIVPATDVSEQISTTTKEASGTSNMKFMMNGAITVATLDGANVEIRDEVGDDNIVIFGMNESEVLNYYKTGSYSAFDVYNNDLRIKRVMDSLIDGTYCSDTERFKPIYHSLLTHNDEFFVLEDFDSYIEAQEKVDKLYRNVDKWQKMCGINIANSGIFSSDRTINEYATEIWSLK
ncbi:MAG: glycogen/starch/alpha-glucan phosphorylase [Clostridium sp.]